MKQIFLFLILASLTLACKKKNEDPTIFEGKVVYVEDGSPAAGVEVAIIPFLKTRPLTGSKSDENKYSLTAEDGGFRIELPYSEEYKHFAMVTSVQINSEDSKIINSGNGLDCSPYDCLDFKPHQNYSNLVIKIDRP